MDIQDAPATVTPIAGGYRVKTAGPIHTNTTWLEHEFKKIVDAKPQRVELDLTNTGFVSSWGIGVLASFRNGIIKNGGELRIIAIPEPVLTTLRYACLHDVFQITPDAVVGRRS